MGGGFKAALSDPHLEGTWPVIPESRCQDSTDPPAPAPAGATSEDPGASRGSLTGQLKFFVKPLNAHEAVNWGNTAHVKSITSPRPCARAHTQAHV